MFEFDYLKALYRRNNFGQPCVWYAERYSDTSVKIIHGIIGHKLTCELAITNRFVFDEIESRFKAKRKTGYKLLNEVKDNNTLPVEGELLTFLDTYLPKDRTAANGVLLPMLAKVYDNENNKLFKKIDSYIGQWKINGLRCFISAYNNSGDMFKPIRLKFVSREGTEWKSLEHLENYLLEVLDKNLIKYMIEDNYILDGELYLPGHSVNEINHFVKDAKCKENRFLQYWCYDIAIEEMMQANRADIRLCAMSKFIKNFKNKEEHLNNKTKLVCLPTINIKDDKDSFLYRNEFIKNGFEGLILRNPDAEYQFGKRNLAMIKYKHHTDGKFKIIDIKPEGIKRPDIPLFIVKNDINNEEFECHVGGTLDYQRSILLRKNMYIDRYMYIEYGERSGIKQVPFHITYTCIVDD